MSDEKDVTRALLFILSIAVAGILLHYSGCVDRPEPVSAEERWRMDNGR